MVRPLAANQRLCEQLIFIFNTGTIRSTYTRRLVFSRQSTVYYSLSLLAKMTTLPRASWCLLRWSGLWSFMQHLVKTPSRISVLPADNLIHLSSNFGLRCIFCPYPLQAEQCASNHQQFRISDFYRLCQIHASKGTNSLSFRVREFQLPP